MVGGATPCTWNFGSTQIFINNAVSVYQGIQVPCCTFHVFTVRHYEIRMSALFNKATWLDLYINVWHTSIGCRTTRPPRKFWYFIIFSACSRSSDDIFLKNLWNPFRATSSRSKYHACCNHTQTILAVNPAFPFSFQFPPLPLLLLVGPPDCD